MKKQNDPRSNDKMPTAAPTRTSAIRRIFTTSLRWAELVDHSPLDYTLDRIGRLEARVVELERARSAAIDISPKSS